MDTILSVQNKVHKKRTEFTKVLRAVRKAKKSFTLTIHLILANPVKTYHVVIERLRLIVQKQTELQNELYDE